MSAPPQTEEKVVHRLLSPGWGRNRFGWATLDFDCYCGEWAAPLGEPVQPAFDAHVAERNRA